MARIPAGRLWSPGCARKAPDPPANVADRRAESPMPWPWRVYRSLPDVQAGHLQASEGAGAGGAHRQDLGGTVASLPAGGSTAARSRGLDGALPALLGRELRPPG